jgi:hypothetical protein
MSISEGRREEGELARGDPDSVIALIREAIGDEDKTRRLQTLVCAPLRTCFHGVTLVACSTAIVAIVAAAVAVKVTSDPHHHIRYIWYLAAGICGGGSMVVWLTSRVTAKAGAVIKGWRGAGASPGRPTGRR